MNHAVYEFRVFAMPVVFVVAVTREILNDVVMMTENHHHGESLGWVLLGVRRRKEEQWSEVEAVICEGAL